jgi:hypothetical protein
LPIGAQDAPTHFVQPRATVSAEADETKESEADDHLGSVEARTTRTGARESHRLSTEELTAIMTSPLRQILQRENDESRGLYWQERAGQASAPMAAHGAQGGAMPLVEGEHLPVVVDEQKPLSYVLSTPSTVVRSFTTLVPHSIEQDVYLVVRKNI